MNTKGKKMKRLILFLGVVALIVGLAPNAWAQGGYRSEVTQIYTYDSIGYLFVRDAAAGALTITDTVSTWTATKNNRVAGTKLTCNKYGWDGGTYTTLGIQAKERAASGYIWSPDEADSNVCYVVCDQSLDGSVWFPVDSLAWVTTDTLANCRIKSVTLVPAPYFRLRTQGKTESAAVRAGSLMVWVYLK